MLSFVNHYTTNVYCLCSYIGYGLIVRKKGFAFVFSGSGAAIITWSALMFKRVLQVKVHVNANNNLLDTRQQAEPLQ